MPHKIDTSSIKRIDVYRSVIESASVVPNTSQDVLNKAVSNMKMELSDLDAKARNLIVSISAMNLLVIASCVITGIVLLFVVPPILTAFVIVLNQLREEITGYNVPTSELTEGSTNVPPLSPTTFLYWQ